MACVSVRPHAPSPSSGQAGGGPGGWLPLTARRKRQAHRHRRHGSQERGHGLAREPRPTHAKSREGGTRPPNELCCACSPPVTRGAAGGLLVTRPDWEMQRGVAGAPASAQTGGPRPSPAARPRPPRCRLGRASSPSGGFMGALLPGRCIDAVSDLEGSRRCGCGGTGGPARLWTRSCTQSGVPPVRQAALMSLHLHDRPPAVGCPSGRASSARSGLRPARAIAAWELPERTGSCRRGAAQEAGVGDTSSLGRPCPRAGWCLPSFSMKGPRVAPL